MKLKPKQFYFLVVTCLVVVLNGCSIPTTITAVIVDIKSNPVNKSGITVSATGSGTTSENRTTSQTQSDGTTTIRLTNAVYPITVTANDGGAHKFSTVIVKKTDPPKVTIVQNPDPLINTGTAPVVSPVR